MSTATKRKRSLLSTTNQALTNAVELVGNLAEAGNVTSSILVDKAYAYKDACKIQDLIERNALMAELDAQLLELGIDSEGNPLPDDVIRARDEANAQA